MNNKNLTGLVIVLGFFVVIESVYILNIQNRPLGYMFNMPHRAPWITPSWAYNDEEQYNQWRPMKEMQRFFLNMDRMFRDSLSRDLRYDRSVFVEKRVFYQPNLSIKQTPEAYIISVDLPGMDKENINVERENNSLTISGQQKSEEKTKDQKISREETYVRYFTRSLTLPLDIKPVEIKTQYKNGILEIILPRTSSRAKAQGTVIKVPVH